MAGALDRRLVTAGTAGIIPSSLSRAESALGLTPWLEACWVSWGTSVASGKAGWEEVGDSGSFSSWPGAFVGAIGVRFADVSDERRLVLPAGFNGIIPSSRSAEVLGLLGSGIGVGWEKNMGGKSLTSSAKFGCIFWSKTASLCEEDGPGIAGCCSATSVRVRLVALLLKRDKRLGIVLGIFQYTSCVDYQICLLHMCRPRTCPAEDLSIA